jgi:hypothetical protein
LIVIHGSFQIGKNTRRRRSPNSSASIRATLGLDEQTPGIRLLLARDRPAERDDHLRGLDDRDREALEHREALAQPTDVLGPVLLGVDDHQVGRKRRDLLAVGVLGAADARATQQAGRWLGAEARDADDMGVQAEVEERLGEARDEADDASRRVRHGPCVQILSNETGAGVRAFVRARGVAATARATDRWRGRHRPRARRRKPSGFSRSRAGDLEVSHALDAPARDPDLGVVTHGADAIGARHDARHFGRVDVERAVDLDAPRARRLGWPEMRLCMWPAITSGTRSPRLLMPVIAHVRSRSPQSPPGLPKSLP